MSVVDRRESLACIGVGGRHVGFGLVVVVVRNEDFDGVLDGRTPLSSPYNWAASVFLCRHQRSVLARSP